MSTHGGSYSMRSKASFENEAKATVKESGGGGSGGKSGKTMSSNSKENLFICFLVTLWYSSNIGVQTNLFRQ
ncbi:hypothetical protein VIGAN_09117600 [Vigna angularis var. angularis]|uniref:Uncharacterized protein n=1 Tax=Vigna angularis var. angularis TaxID=157739 RepID=A0A0S3SXS5_PHAAN|nr:hypothetical protein VIGAN_09117600 [Vigna angularis var. angularis]